MLNGMAESTPNPPTGKAGLEGKVDQLIKRLAEHDERDKKREWTDRLGRCAAYLAFAGFFFGIGNFTNLTTRLGVHPTSSRTPYIRNANSWCGEIEAAPAATFAGMVIQQNNLQSLVRGLYSTLGDNHVLRLDLAAAREYWRAELETRRPTPRRRRTMAPNTATTRPSGATTPPTSPKSAGSPATRCRTDSTRTPPAWPRSPTSTLINGQLPTS